MEGFNWKKNTNERRLTMRLTRLRRLKRQYTKEMGRFYCDYCKSYLTHDATSVRKNHLSGKNHVKLVCDYYEEEAKKQGLFNPNELPFEITKDNLYRGIPGSTTVDLEHLYKLSMTKTIPPPPTLQHFPQPPPRVLHDNQGKELLGNVLKTVN